MHPIKKLATTGLAWLFIAILCVGLDRYAKLWMLSNLNLYESLPVTSFFNLTLAFNTGAAFSFLHSASGWQNILFGGLAFAVSVAIIVWLSRISVKDRLTSMGLSFILGGAIGNAWDRIQYGYVIDFLDFHWGDWHFAIFNTADSAICLGAFLLLLQWAIEAWGKKNSSK
ncbi:MAG: lipoprotein signal peptidase [Gammaproteobacteria bacterium]|nr:lipoprotein signal peptidase [Gammaproteobacteria bacterium]